MRILLSLMLLNSCVHSPTTVEVFGPDGESYSSMCRNINDCYNEAHRICDGNYKLIDSSSRSIQQLVPNGANPVILNHISNQILYACK